MPYRNIFEKDKPAHIVSRAIEGKRIFQDEEDCFRFILQAYAVNIGSLTKNLLRWDAIKIAQAILQGEEISSKFIIKEHSPLVDFLEFNLVVNHNHLYLVPKLENSIPILMRNLNNGFAQYFNLKHKRKGVVFDGPYRAVIARTQFQSDAISRYIGVINTLDVFQPGWREKGLKDSSKAFKFLETYQFSSFPDKIGKRKSKMIAPDHILEKYLTFGANIKNYREFVKEFLKGRSESSREFFLE